VPVALPPVAFRRRNEEMRSTRSHLRIFALVLLAFALLGLGQNVVRADDDDDDDDDGNRVVLSTTLRGSEEVPGPGDPDGRGSARIAIDLAENVLCFRLSVKRIEPATAAHIHIGPPGVAGDVVVGLTPPTPRSSGCIDNVDSALLAAIAANPADYYVNVHNAPFPRGAVRGQLSRQSDDD